MVARKSTKKKTARKTTRKKTARKTTRKKTSRKPTGRAASLLGDELPRSLKAFGRQLRRDLTAIEKQIESSRRQTRRSLTRIVRDTSHQLGVLETKGQKQWRAMSMRARREVESTLRKVRRAAKT